jgi:hypothetical protein
MGQEPTSPTTTSSILGEYNFGYDPSKGTSSEPGPLTGLYSNKYKHTFLQYPLDLESASENHWVRFDVKELKGVPVSDMEPSRGFPGITTSGGILGKVAGGGRPGLGDLVSNVAEKATTALVTAAIAAPLNAVSSVVNEFLNDLPPALGGVGKAIIGGALGAGKSTTKELASIMLYAPHSRQDTLKLNWAQAEVGQLGAGLMAGGGTIGSTVMNQIKSLAGGQSNQSLTSLIEQAPDILQGVFSGFVGKQLGQNEHLEKVTLRAKGKALNPHLEMFFSNVDFRTFTFDFKLAPRNSQEAEQIRQIVKMFKYAGTPGLIDGRYGRFFAYPNIFDITMFNEAQTHRISRSCLSNIQVDHSGAGVNSTFYDDYPVETNLNLTFTEIDILHKKKVDQGF